MQCFPYWAGCEPLDVFIISEAQTVLRGTQFGKVLLKNAVFQNP